MSVSPLHPDFAQKLDPEYVAYYNANLADKPALHDLPWDPAVRKGPPIQGASAPLPVGAVKDFSLSKFSVRVFTPEGKAPKNGWPVFLFFHGGAL